MEKITKLINLKEIEKIFSTDKEKFVKIQNVMNDLELYDAKYGISIDEINIKEGFGLEFCITVPEHSELKSDREFEMCGIYLANQFKTNVASMIEKLSELIDDFSKLPRIKVKYTSSIGSKLTVEESENNLANLKETMGINSYFPFEEYQVY
jgi:hypothetical protein